MGDAPAKVERLVFRPERFFDGRLNGWGVVRDVSGRVIQRYTIEVEGGWVDLERAFHLQETYRFDNGVTDAVRWTLSQDDEGQYVGREERAGSAVHGRWDGPDYRLRMVRPTRTSRGGYIRLGLDVRFTMIDPSVAISLSRVSRWGLPIASLAAFYRRETPLEDVA